MKKKTVIAMMMAMAVTASVFTGCGSADSLAGTGTGNMSVAGLEKPSVTQGAEDVAEVQEAVPADVAGTPEEEKPAEENKAEGTMAENKGTEKAAESKPAANTNTPAKGSMGTQAKTETKPNTVKTPNTVKPAGNTGNGNTTNGNTGSGNTSTTKPAGSTVNTGSTGITAKPSGNTSGNTENPVVTKPSGNTDSNTNSATENTGSGNHTAVAPKPEEPVHTHTWKDHKATKQEWVPNIVTVDDYETQTTEMSYSICNCGATFDFTEEGRDAFDYHMIAHIEAGETTSYRTGHRTDTTQVKVGSHEEDHGHYETVEYVDYQYCDCGARQ